MVKRADLSKTIGIIKNYTGFHYASNEAQKAKLDAMLTAYFERPAVAPIGFKDLAPVLMMAKKTGYKIVVRFAGAGR
jgi:hypothetical protein